MRAHVDQAIENMAHLKNAPKLLASKHSMGHAYEKAIRELGLASDAQIAAAAQFFAEQGPSSEFPSAKAFATKCIGVAPGTKIGIVCYVAIEGTAYVMDREKAGRWGLPYWDNLGDAERAAQSQWEKLNPTKAAQLKAWREVDPKDRARLAESFKRRRKPTEMGVPGSEEAPGMSKIGANVNDLFG